MSNKSNEWSGLLKLPDSVLLKQSLIENGKLQAYIQELEDKLKVKGIAQVEKGSIEALEMSNKALRRNLESMKANRDKYKEAYEALSTSSIDNILATANADKFIWESIMSKNK